MNGNANNQVFGTIVFTVRLWKIMLFVYIWNQLSAFVHMLSWLWTSHNAYSARITWYFTKSASNRNKTPCKRSLSKYVIYLRLFALKLYFQVDKKRVGLELQWNCMKTQKMNKHREWKCAIKLVLECCEFKASEYIVIHRVCLKPGHSLFPLEYDNWIRWDLISYKRKLEVGPIKPIRCP